MNDSDMISKNYAHVLTEALPFIRRYEGKTVVIKYGGNAMIEPKLQSSFASDMVLLKKVGINPVIVHGGGPQINKMLDKQGVVSEFINGLRVTSKEAIDIVEMVLGGLINKDIVRLINSHGGKAVGLSGKDADLIQVKKINLQDDSGKDIDLGFVGEIEQINSHLVKVLEENKFIPVIAPIGVGKDGHTYNINADIVAGELAVALKAERLLLLTNTPGVQDDENSLISELNYAQSIELIKNGTISGGMIPKVNCALSAIKKGVAGAVILNGRIEHVTLLEIFSDKGIGTFFKP